MTHMTIFLIGRTWRMLKNVTDMASRVGSLPRIKGEGLKVRRFLWMMQRSVDCQLS